LLFTAVFSLVAMGGMFSERSGIINIGLEGIMCMGAAVGAIVFALMQRTPDPATMGKGTVNFLTYVQGSGKWLMIIIPLLTAGLVGVVFSMLLAFASINLKADQTIGGTALNMLAAALALIFVKMVNKKLVASGTPNLSYNRSAFIINIKLGTVNFELYWFFIVALLALAAAIIILYYTKFGLRLRSCGEHPQASASVGINVFKMRYIGVAISGLLGGIGGLAFIIPSVGTWNFEQGVCGAGFLALSVMIFGQWKPGKIFLAALFFALFKAMSCIPDSLFPALVAKGITGNIFNMIPFILSIIVLAFTSSKSRAPKAEGLPYEKGMR